jgi:hypothetical protein
MAAVKGIQLLSTALKGNTGAAKKSVAVTNGQKVPSAADTAYEFVVDEQPGLPKGTKIVKRENALDFELPDGRVFQLADWCGVDNSKLVGLGDTQVYDATSGKWIEGVEAIASNTCAWAGLNGTAGSVGVAEGFGAAWLALLAIPVIGIAAGSSGGGSSAAAPVVLPTPAKPNAILNAASDSGTQGDNTTTDDTPTISGSGATAGDTIKVVTPKGEVLTTIVAADGTWSVTPTIAFALGAAAVQITETSPNGNVSESNTLNLVIVGPNSFTASVPEGPVINLAESTSGGGVPVAIALPANAAAGDKITVSIDGSTPVAYTVTAADVAARSASVLIPTADVTAAGQGPATVTATYTDTRGNQAPNVTIALTIDTVIPSDFIPTVPEGPVINLAESTSGGGVPVAIALPANAAAGDKITVSIDGSAPVAYTVTAADVAARSASVLIPTADVTAAGQGPALVTSTYTDAAGNPATTKTNDLTIDTGAPANFTTSIAEGPIINLTESTDGGGVPVTINLPGNAVAGDIITVSIDGSTPIQYVVKAADLTATTPTAFVTIPTADINAAGQGDAVVTTTYTDVAGNPAPSRTTSLTIDTIAPTLDLDGNNSSNKIVSINGLGFYNTGLTADGSAVLADGDQDTHYILTAQPAPGGRQPLATTEVLNIWLQNDLTAGADGDVSKWIGNIDKTWLGGEYQWTTTFTVAPGVDLSTILLSFDVAADNFLTDILVNGIRTGITLNQTDPAANYGPQSTATDPTFVAGHHVEISGVSNYFQAGLNSITFITYNGEALTTPTDTEVGLRVDNAKATYLSTGSDTAGNLAGYATTYVEGATRATAVADSDAKIVDASNIQSASITLTNPQASDVLGVIAGSTLPTGITASTYNATTGVLTLSGADTVANYQAALNLIGFSNVNADPATNPVRSISFTLTDVAGNVSTATTGTVTVVALISTATSITPVALDLNQDGAIDYSQINMDVNGDGVLDRTAWTGAQDGVLVWDQFHNGQVVSSSQYAFSQYGGATDLSGLAAGFDTNHDGLFDASDAKFSEFAAWQDSNQNGVSDAGEVLSLASLGITSINLVSDGTLHSPSAGVQVLGQSHATLANGGQMLVDDAKFTYRPLTLNELVQPDHDAELAKLVADAPAVAPVSASSLMTQIMLDQELLLASHA